MCKKVEVLSILTGLVPVVKNYHQENAAELATLVKPKTRQPGIAQLNGLR